ncbi:uncharacterized protein PgNI_08984, partial [Pyricularia grisea]|uniref:Uncharacterized protein n=1 Tax=Pyricularia grisea TaxID=148305 RepID=A0A6P8AWA5_PYRGI
STLWKVALLGQSQEPVDHNPGRGHLAKISRVDREEQLMPFSTLDLPINPMAAPELKQPRKPNHAPNP